MIFIQIKCFAQLIWNRIDNVLLKLIMPLLLEFSFIPTFVCSNAEKKSSFIVWINLLNLIYIIRDVAMMSCGKRLCHHSITVRTINKAAEIFCIECIFCIIYLFWCCLRLANAIFIQLTALIAATVLNIETRNIILFEMSTYTSSYSKQYIEWNCFFFLLIFLRLNSQVNPKKTTKFLWFKVKNWCTSTKIANHFKVHLSS